jgi:hypothetical protein
MVNAPERKRGHDFYVNGKGIDDGRGLVAQSG